MSGGGVATWHRLEPHGPPVVELRVEAGKGLVGLFTPWGCTPEAGEDILKQEMWKKKKKGGEKGICCNYRNMGPEYGRSFVPTSPLTRLCDFVQIM